MVIITTDWSSAIRIVYIRIVIIYIPLYMYIKNIYNVNNLIKTNTSRLIINKNP